MVALGAASLGVAGTPAGAQDGGPPGTIEQSATAIAGQYIVTLADVSASAVGATAADLAADHDADVTHTYEAALRGFAAEMSEADAAELSKDPRVASVSEDGRYEADETQPFPPWGLDRIDERHLPRNGTFTYLESGAGVTAYVIDTGIRLTHSEFDGRATSGWDFVDNDADASDGNGHGTHVAGILGGEFYGVAKDVSLVAVRVLGNNGSGDESDIIAGIDWVTADHDAGPPPDPAVVNMSIGGPPSVPLQTAVQNAINDKITFVVSAGNNNTLSCNQSPANVGDALTVGASTMNDTKASFSNWGTCVDLYAPGSDIPSAGHMGDHHSFTESGTSMAAPHAAGVVAAYLDRNPGVNSATFAMNFFATPSKIFEAATGNTKPLLYHIFSDETPPSVTLTTPPDDAVYEPDQAVHAAFSCLDDPDGIGPHPPITPICQGTVNNGAAINTSTEGFHDFTVTSRDTLQNETVVTHTYLVTDDETDPTATITTPGDAATYEQGSSVAADYECADEPGGSGLASCTGPVADGADIDTAGLGPHPFTVTATDHAGNTGDDTHTYTVVDEVPQGVSGTVTQAGSGTPLEGAWVAVLRSHDFSIAAGAVTDANGDFEAEVRTGDYYLYLIDPTGRHTAGFHGIASVVTVTADTFTDVDPEMVSTRGTISGTITESGSGTPIDGAWAVTLDAGTGQPGPAGVSDASGDYTIPDLPEGGRLLVYVDPAGEHQPEFHDDSPGPGTADAVTVTAGTTATADAALSPIAGPGTGATLEGTVSEDGGGQPIDGAWVVALHAATYGIAAGTTADANGDYLLDLAPGDYKLEFLDPTGGHQMEWHDDLPFSSIGDADSVTVAAGPSTVVDASLARTDGSVSGTVTDASTTDPVAGAWVLTIGATGINGGAVTAADGTYTIDGLAPGESRATVVVPGGDHAQQYFDASPDYDGSTPFTVTAGATTPGIDFALT